MPPTPHVWRGEIHKDGDGIAGEIRDTFGFVIQITGRRTNAGYEVEGRAGPVPEAYAIPGDDDP